MESQTTTLEEIQNIGTVVIPSTAKFDFDYGIDGREILDWSTTPHVKSSWTNQKLKAAATQLKPKLSGVRLKLAELDKKYSKPSIDRQRGEDLLTSDDDLKLVIQTKEPMELPSNDEKSPNFSGASNDLEVKKEKPDLNISEENANLNQTASDPRQLLDDSTPDDIESITSDRSMSYEYSTSIHTVNQFSSSALVENVHSVSSLPENLVQIKEDNTVHKEVQGEKEQIKSYSSSETTSSISLDLNNKDSDATSSTMSPLTSESKSKVRGRKVNSMEKEKKEFIGTGKMEEQVPAEGQPDTKMKYASPELLTMRNSSTEHTAGTSVKLDIVCKKTLGIKKPTKENNIKETTLTFSKLNPSQSKSEVSYHAARAESDIMYRLTHVPALKAVRLPNFKPCNVPSSEGCVRTRMDSFEAAVSDLVSHHLSLTQQLIERQYRLYVSQCRTVQLLEKYYQSEMHLEKTRYG